MGSSMVVFLGLGVLSIRRSFLGDIGKVIQVWHGRKMALPKQNKTKKEKEKERRQRKVVGNY